MYTSYIVFIFPVPILHLILQYTEVPSYYMVIVKWDKLYHSVISTRNQVNKN